MKLGLGLGVNAARKPGVYVAPTPAAPTISNVTLDTPAPRARVDRITATATVTTGSPSAEFVWVWTVT